VIAWSSVVEDENGLVLHQADCIVVIDYCSLDNYISSNLYEHIDKYIRCIKRCWE